MRRQIGDAVVTSSEIKRKNLSTPKPQNTLRNALLVFLIIAFVPYTKIDWDAYMSQVTGFLEGERDYRNLKGDTGPLVYPAGSVVGTLLAFSVEKNAFHLRSSSIQ